ncbi:uncharacterized protein LOC112164267 [Rosa chinensis]|uniref:uncharacterized protein LOC112164267 n=1 Tax=Rosa chinensis TaxID=74649 RepID=UPI000D08969C|nr:uncharacterized protein LOC112164267 [Rosa chinensis]
MEEEVEAFHSLYERLSSYLVEKEAYDRVATLEIVNEEFTDKEGRKKRFSLLKRHWMTHLRSRFPHYCSCKDRTNEFVWEPKHQEAFEKIKAYLASPPVLVPPRAGFPLKLYVSAAEASMGSLLAQDDEEGVEHAIFYLTCKLRHYMLSFTTCIIAQTDLVKYMLSRPILRGRIGKWVLALSEFSLQYVPQKAVKGQAIADFLAHHPMLDVPAVRDLEVAATTLDRPDLACLPEYAALYQTTVSFQPWVLYFDRSRTDTLAGAGIALENPAGDHFSYSFQLEFQCTNNQAEYEDLIIGLEVLLEMGIRDVQIFGDSLLVINQL